MFPHLARSALTSAAGRLIVGYLLFRLLTIWRTEAAPIGANWKQTASSICTATGLQDYLQKLDHQLTENDIQLVYEHCRAEFMETNKISESVKQTVDDWVGTDLGRAETNQIFLAYELALMGPRPQKLSENFKSDCREMVNQFQNFRDSLEPLTSRIEIGLDTLLASGSEEIDEEERDLLNFVQYSQFCKSLLTPPITGL